MRLRRIRERLNQFNPARLSRVRDRQSSKTDRDIQNQLYHFAGWQSAHDHCKAEGN